MDDWHGWQPKERSPLVLHTNKHVEWEIPSVITGWSMSQWRFSRTGLSQGSSLGQDSAWWCNDAVATDAKDKSILSVSVGFLDFDDLLSPTLLRVWRTNEGLSCEARYVPAAVNRSHFGRPFFWSPQWHHFEPKVFSSNLGIVGNQAIPPDDLGLRGESNQSLTSH